MSRGNHTDQVSNYTQVLFSITLCEKVFHMDYASGCNIATTRQVPFSSLVNRSMKKSSTIIALTSNKGGTGKTTVSLGLGAGLARLGKRVLLVDMDQQGNLSSGAGCNDPAAHIGLLLRELASWEQTLVKGQQTNIDLIPASNELIPHEALLSVTPGKEFILDELLDEHARHYDFVLIDCPPNLGTMTFMALNAADYYIVPIQGENFAYQGLAQIRNFVATVRSPRFNPKLTMAGILLNKFRDKTRFGGQVLDMLNQSEDSPVFATRIGQDLALMEATAEGLNIFDYNPKSKAAASFEALSQELISLLQHHGEEKSI